MKIFRDDPKFRPLTIRLETQDDLDKFHAIIDAVAQNRITHAPPLIRAAVDFRTTLHTIINED